jgi:uncharacterized protein
MLKSCRGVRAGIVASLVTAAIGCYVLAGCSTAEDETDETTSDIRASSDLVISQVYGGGGDTSGDAGPAAFTHDYVELFNRGKKPIALEGKAILYASERGKFSRGNVTRLKGKPLAPAHHFLVQLGMSARDGGGPTTDGGADGESLRLKPDQIATGGAALMLSAKKGVVAITATVDACVTIPDGGADGCKLLDKVGYGASSFEGSGPAPELDAQTAAHRRGRGCIDTNDNATDFVAAPPAPRNRLDSAMPCVDRDGGGGDGDAAGGALDASRP